MAYITAAQFILQYDKRRIAQLLSDTGTPITAAALTSDATLAQILEEASGYVSAACRVGQRYLAASLDTCAAASTPSGNLLRRITGDLAFGLLVARRGLSMDELYKQAPFYQMAMGYLEQLRLGERLFDIDTTAQAGVPDVAVLGSANDAGAFNPKSISSKTRIWGQTPFNSSGW